jgi:hypothetical protein
MVTKKSAASEVDELAKRVAELEKQLRQLAAQADQRPGGVMVPELHCAIPYTKPREFGPEVSAERQELLIVTGNKWVNGTQLHYYFFEDELWGAGNDQKDVVRQGFEVWQDVGIGLEFEEVASPDAAEIRIGFEQGDGYWSYIGTYLLNIGQSERTMNFGQDLTRDSRGVDVPVHEIGHTLGFPHSHQNPFSGIVWDRDAVIDYFSGHPNYWPLDKIESNVLDKLPRRMVEGSTWDPNSIMHYAFQAGLILQPQEYQSGLTPAPGLSDTDIEQVHLFYPAARPSYSELKLFESQKLSLAMGEQKNFSISPTATRQYTIQTFGPMDSVMVLFEDRDGTFQFVAGDDDSGWNRNARLNLRLYAGRKYVLRIRLYYQWASGDIAVMMW